MSKKILVYTGLYVLSALMIAFALMIPKPAEGA
jgi:hypothetical protein